MAKAKMLTKEIEKKLPPLRSQEDKDPSEVRVYLKVFNPYGGGRWYVTEYDAAERLGFGYVTGLGDDELGYISLEELEGVRVGPFKLPLERDQWWDDKTTLADVMSGKVF